MFLSIFECFNYVICKVTMNNIMKNDEKKNDISNDDYIKDYEYIDYEPNIMER